MTDASKAPAFDVPEQLRIRRDKRQRILKSGKDAYPVEVPRTHSLSEVRARWAVRKDDGEAEATSAEIGEDALAEWKADVDLGDFIGVTGRVIASLRGELSVMVSSSVEFSHSA